jgi:hypothetical protein
VSGEGFPAIRNNLETEPNQEELMTGKRKSAVGRADRSEADLGQKEVQLEKTQAELETASEAQLSYEGRQSGQGRSSAEGDRSK